MMDQNLIDTIVNEIYTRLKQCEKEPSKAKLLLIGTLQEEDQKVLQAGYQMIREPSMDEAYECILISELSLERLGHLALGCSPYKEDQIILEALLEEKQVYVLEGGIAYRKYKKTTYKPLYMLYEAYENRIKQYGIQIISHLGDLLLDKKEEQVSVYAPPVDLKDKKLLLETDLMHRKLGAFTVIEISKKCIVTPLADDFIKSHKLKIKRI